MKAASPSIPIGRGGAQATIDAAVAVIEWPGPRAACRARGALFVATPIVHDTALPPRAGGVVGRLEESWFEGRFFGLREEWPKLVPVKP